MLIFFIEKQNDAVPVSRMMNPPALTDRNGRSAWGVFPADADLQLQIQAIDEFFCRFLADHIIM